ncbi:MAG: helix-turn-helix domain-containing protein [bacterium]
MVSVSYSEILRDSKDPYWFRIKLAEFAAKYGIWSATRQFKCSRNTVRKWLRRWQKEGTNGLRNRSRRPKISPNRTPKELEDQVLELRKQLKKISGKRMRMEFGIPLQPSTIYRIYHDNNMPKITWKKHKRKQDLRAVKAKLKVFEKIQIDIKDLSDIPHYYHGYRRSNLPRYQFTARDVKSGAMFVSYSKTKGLENASTFCAYLLAHLKRLGINVKEVGIQTDNDGAFVGNWRPGSHSTFTYVIEEIYKALHMRIPPSAPTYNSDVETAHARIEEELYDVEDVDSIYDLLCKSYSYIIYFNLIRPNSYKAYKSPLKIIAEEYGAVDPALLTLPPIILDDNFHIYFNTINNKDLLREGHHVSGLPKIIFGVG